MTKSNFDVNAYVDEILKDSGLAEDAQKQLRMALSNDAIASKLGETVLMRSDYSRNMDELRVAKEAAEAEKQKTSDYYNELRGWWTSEQAARETEKQAVAAYKERYGELRTDRDPDDDGRPKRNYLTKEEAEEFWNKKAEGLNNAYVKLTKDVARITTDYVTRFKEPLDVDALEKLALSKQVPLDIAYKEFIAPKLAAIEADEHKKALADAKEEGRKEAMSKVNFPVDITPSEPHPWRVHQEGKVEPDARKRVDAAVTSFKESSTQSK